MTRPDDPDDVDDVTLWAGRLRPWPSAAPPAVDPDDVETTALSARGVDDKTVVSPRSVDEDTVVSPRSVEEPTVASPRPPARAEEPASALVSTEVDDDDTDPRMPGTLGASPMQPDDDTDPRRRPPSVVPGAAADDDTDPRRPLSVVPGAAADDDTQIVVRRRPGAVPGATSPGAADADLPGIPDVDDETIAAARSGRDDDTSPRGGGSSGSLVAEAATGRAALRRAASVDPLGEHPFRREARVPSADGNDAYAPRRDEAVRVSRSSPQRRSSSADAGAVRPRSPRKGSALLLILGGGVLVLAAVGVAAVLLLTL